MIQSPNTDGSPNFKGIDADERENIAKGYVRRSDGSWIAMGMATPVDMQFHIWFYQEYYKPRY